MTNNSKHTAVVIQPKYKTMEFLPAVKNARCEENYIIVCCSPDYNGVWKYKRADVVGITSNGKIDCFRVPIDKCTYIGDLAYMMEKDKSGFTNYVREVQQKYWAGEIKNGTAKTRKQPSYFI